MNNSQSTDRHTLQEPENKIYLYGKRRIKTFFAECHNK